MSGGRVSGRTTWWRPAVTWSARAKCQLESPTGLSVLRNDRVDMHAALLLIDLQNDYLGSEQLEPSRGALCAAAARLLGGWRRVGLPVVHVWTTIRHDDERMPHWRRNELRRCIAGTPGHAVPDQVQPAAGEYVHHKC